MLINTLVQNMDTKSVLHLSVHLNHRHVVDLLGCCIMWKHVINTNS